MSEWISVKDRSPIHDDETDVLIGSYYIDNCGGYYGGDKWLWICQGSFAENGDFFDSFNDEYIKARHMTGHRRYTHWKPLPNPPEDK